MAKAKHIAIDNAVYDIEPSGDYVTGVKGNSESSYRTGNVNITKNNIGLSNVGNFKAVSTVASQGLTDTEKSNARDNIGAGTSSFSGDYNDLSNKPTIPTVNNGTLTIQKNGSNVETFTANSSSNKTANITVPTKTSELTNDSGFITDAGVTGVKGSNESTYRTGNVNLSKTNIGLGNVPNVTTNNQTPTFAQASTRDNIASGEKLTTLFGKIMKWFADLKTVAFSGSYTDLSDKPTIPTVNNATLTIQRNGTNVQTFTANASSNKTANISCNSISALKTVSKTGVTVPANGYAQVVLAHTAGSTDNCIVTNWILQGAYQAHVFAVSTDNSNIYVNIGNTTNTAISNLIVEVWYRIRS